MDKPYITYERVCQLIDEPNLDIKETSKNVTINPAIMKDKVNDKYKFVLKNVFFKTFAFIFYVFVLIVLGPILYLHYFPKVRGRKNLKKVKNAVFVSNHVFALDCAVLDIYALPFKRPYILTDKNSVTLPIVKPIIRSLLAVPIPDGIAPYKNFVKSLDSELSRGKSLLVYPEGTLWPYFPRIKPFKNGAFRFAVKNNLPVIPIVLSFRKPSGFYRMFGRKVPFLNVDILEPIYINTENSQKDEELRVNDLVHEKMSETMNAKNSYIFIDKKRLEKEKKLLPKDPPPPPIE